MTIPMAHGADYAPPHFINKQGESDHTYLSWFKGKKIVVFAPSLYAAKQLALSHFKPAKKDEGLLAIELQSVQTNPASVALQEGVA